MHLQPHQNMRRIGVVGVVRNPNGDGHQGLLCGIGNLKRLIGRRGRRICPAAGDGVGNGSRPGERRGIGGGGGEERVGVQNFGVVGDAQRGAGGVFAEGLIQFGGVQRGGDFTPLRRRQLTDCRRLRPFGGWRRDVRRGASPPAAAGATNQPRAQENQRGGKKRAKTGASSFHSA